MPNRPQDACCRMLEREFGSQACRDPDHIESYSWDFGKLIQRTPAIVLTVHDTEQLVTALKIGAEFGMPISTRGSGHSQSGQCLSQGAVVLDMRGLQQVQFDADCGSAWLDAGATWQDVANASFARAMLPVGLPLTVNIAVGGTLSVGGLGSESFRTGTQADQVLELEVATFEGKMERCSPGRNRALYDAVRAGLGQCGIIVRARYPLRRAKAYVRTLALLYSDPQSLLQDMTALSAHARCEFMFARLGWDGQGGWQLLLMLGKEFDVENELDDDALLSGLSCQRTLVVQDTPQWRPDGLPGHRLFRREEQDDSEVFHPWVGHLCEPTAALEILTRVISESPIAPRAGTNGGLLVVSPHPNRAPLFLPRTDRPLALLQLYPEPSRDQLADTLVRMRRHIQQGCALGGKLYLPGFLDGWDASDWSMHFGEVWPWFRAMKERFDPRGLLNSDCIRWR